MSPTWQLFLQITLEWLKTPTTWYAVLGPGLFSVSYLLRSGASRIEALSVLLGAALSVYTSNLLEVDGALELHDPGWYCIGVLVLAGLRLYLPPAGKAYALCWLVLVLSDVTSMLLVSASYPEVQLPRGIGGAGIHDALYFKPMMLALGLLLLDWARRRHAAKQKSRQQSLR